MVRSLTGARPWQRAYRPERNDSAGVVGSGAHGDVTPPIVWVASSRGGRWRIGNREQDGAEEVLPPLGSRLA
jgi:hypothetical protein